MRKSIMRVLAMLITFTLSVLLFISADDAVMTAEAASGPVFSLETNVNAAKTGDIFTVSLYVNNNSDTSISSFDGDISFNGSHFRYIDFSYPDNMRGKLTCLDNVAQPSSEISLSFADTSKLMIPAGASHVLLLQVRFEVISTVAGNGQVICSIKNCYGGSKSYENIEPTNFLLPVLPTQPTQSTTTTTTTITTTQPTRPRSGDAKLKSLSVAPGMLSPNFNPEFVAYTVNVEFEIATIRVSAVANSDEAVVSGVGVKDLAVGQNTFTVTVTAGDGTVMQYGVVVIRAQETPQSVPIIIDESSTTTQTTTTSSMAPIYSETVPMPVQTTSSIPEKVIESGNSVSDAGMVKIMGIVFAEVALFMFGFLAGFFLDKNMKKKSAAEMSAMPPVQPPYPRRPMPPVQQPPYPPQAMPRQPEYQQEYAPSEYQEDYSSDYNNFPQYDSNEDSRYDEYGNPIESSQYDVYFDNNDSYYN